MEDSHYPVGPSALFTELPSTSSPPNNNIKPDGYTPQSSADISQERLWNDLSAMYSKNETTKKDATKDTSRKLDSLLDGFLDNANTIMEALGSVGHAHPVLASKFLSLTSPYEI